MRPASPPPFGRRGFSDSRLSTVIKIGLAFILALFLAPVCASPAGAGDEMRAVSALWQDFVAALRRGDYRSAHGMFSPESRLALPYADFVREYGPLSAAREMVLARPESMSVRMDGDWAEIASSGVLPESERRLNLGVAAVNNQGTWGLVAGRNEAAERIESMARSLLRRLAAWRGRPDADERLKEFVAAETARENPVLARYRFEAGRGVFHALPLQPGLRRFYVDAWGEVRSGLPSSGQPPGSGGRGQTVIGGSPARTRALPPDPFAARPLAANPKENGESPELSEPPASRPELPELPEPAGRGTAVPPFEPDPVSLPDAIR